MRIFCHLYDRQSFGSTPASSVLTSGTSYGDSYMPNSYGTNQPTAPSVIAYDNPIGSPNPSASEYSSPSSFTANDPQAQPGHWRGYSQYPPSFQGYGQGNQQPTHYGNQPGTGAGYQQQYSQYGMINTEGTISSSSSRLLCTMTGNNAADKPGHIINCLKMLPVSNVSVSQY